MGEGDVLDETPTPRTVESLAADLRELGVDAGDTLLVHSSLGSLGWVCGGAPAVVDALMEAAPGDGTLVLPTHSTDYTDPTPWENPPVPDEWIPTVRETMPAYRPAVTPTRGMGAIPECFRNYPDVVRSRHPAHSFAAWGAAAESVTSDHSYGNGLGEQSPLARVYDRDGYVLLLGVGHDRNTSLHLAEYRADYDSTRSTTGSPVLVDGERRWVEYDELDGDTDDFPDVGAAFEREHPDAMVEGEVGSATAKLVSQPALVDFAAEWFSENRP